jgi:LmbE family N-acetylglucosaminyl deacetylase
MRQRFGPEEIGEELLHRPRICIIVPHPDDLDILVGHTVQSFIKVGFRVFELLMTGGEYGIANRFTDTGDRLKGKWLQRVRIRENTASKLTYGTFEDGLPKVITIPMGYIDGYVPFNARSVAFLKNTIRKINPAAVIGPDPVFSIDWHRDHMATARNMYCAMQRLLDEKASIRHYWVFQSFQPQRMWPFESWDLFIRACVAHRSQMTPLGTKLLAGFFRCWKKILYNNRQSLREIHLKDLRAKKDQREFTRVWQKIIYVLLKGTNQSNRLYEPTPTELGLSEKIEID